MKSFLTLLEHDLRAIKKPLFWLVVVMGPAQFAVTLLYAFTQRSSPYLPPYSLLSVGMVVPALCMLAAAFLNFSTMVRQNGRSKAIYTLMTLPSSRSLVYWASVASGIIAIWVVVAAQAIWYMLLYAPTAWANDLISAAYCADQATYNMGYIIPQGFSSFTRNGMVLGMLRTESMRTLFPMSLMGTLLMLCSMTCPVICLQSILCRRGILRITHSVLFAFCGIATLFAMATSALDGAFPYLGDQYAWNFFSFFMVIQVLLATICAISALRGLKRSKNL